MAKWAILRLDGLIGCRLHLAARHGRPTETDLGHFENEDEDDDGDDDEEDQDQYEIDEGHFDEDDNN